MTMDVHHHRNVTAASSSPPSSRYSPPTAIEAAPQDVTSISATVQAASLQKPQKRSFDVAFLMAPDDLSKRRPRPPPPPPTVPTLQQQQPVARSAFTKVRSPDPSAIPSPGSSPPLDFGGYHHLQKQYHHHQHQHHQQQQQDRSAPLQPSAATHFMSPFPGLGFRTPFAMMMPPRPLQPAAKDYPLQQQQQQQQQLPSPSALQFGPAAAAAAAVAALPAMLLPASIAAAALTLPSQNVCAKCNVSFRMTSDLVYHMRSHHKGDHGGGHGGGGAGVAPGGHGADNKKRRDADKLRCPVCDESFRERHHLTRHMTAHQDKEGDRLDDEDDAPLPRPPAHGRQGAAK